MQEGMFTMYSSDLFSLLHTGICVVLLVGIGVLSWQRRAQQAIVCGTLLLYAQYMTWRGLSTLNTSTWQEAAISWTVFLAEAYGFAQLSFFAFQVWETTERQTPAIHTYRSVDIFVPIVNEPLSILRRTLVSCLNQHYPKDKYRVYVLDDGHREDVQHLANALGCQYLRRSNRAHAKAGNLNHALAETGGDLIAIFDTDHAPAASFLIKTIGFFDDDKVSFVQTPQHFYNPDIFQNNLSLKNEIPNEQALFFRVVQPGRDRHNSAFFAGSGGIFRRQTLSQIGGFQTDTITEDIHTSLLIHAKGYESRYLNLPLAAGLMPETFESLLKQRARWASGTWQMLFRSNPLLLPGLTWAQRINYLAAVWYFGFGLPRVICLVAPLSGLLFGIAPVNAFLWELVVYYGSYFVASLLMMKMVSKGTRIALWSEVYEIAMCFRTSWAVLTTLVQPYAESEFVITPKGLQQDRRHFAFRSVHPHLITIGLLILGLCMGIARLLQDAAEPGIQITIVWGAVNLLLLCVTMVAALDAQQWRKVTRLPRKVPCTVFIGNEVYKAMTEDLSEGGAQICMPASARVILDDNGSQEVTLTLTAPNGKELILKAQLRAQRTMASGEISCGVDFIGVDDKMVHALIGIMFGDENIWSQAVPPSGIWKNLWWLLSVMRIPFSLPRASFRRSRRIPCHEDCQGIFCRYTLNGTIKNISAAGLMAEFTGTAEQLEEEGCIQIDHCVLHVRRMWSRDQEGKVLAGFRIECIKEGEQYWQELLSPAIPTIVSRSKAA
jgi:cellulose synthase (UDP-forming)